MIKTDAYSIEMEKGILAFNPFNPSPVIISIPHDGMSAHEFHGIVQPRKVGHKGKDARVWPVVKDITRFVMVNTVRGLMPRQFVDYNRAWPEGINYYPKTQKDVHTALDDSRLIDAYYYYHQTIDEMVDKAKKNFSRDKILLIDMHGFSRQPQYAPQGGFDLILGTGNRVTIPHGDVDVRLADFMSAKNYEVFLPKHSCIGPEEDSYSADYTTRHHSEKHNINVIQVEIASRFRAKDAGSIGLKLSVDFAEFLTNNCF